MQQIDIDFQEVLLRIRQGESLRTVAADMLTPVTTMLDRLRADPDLSAKYDSAQRDRAHALADQILEIARACPPEKGHVARARLEIDSLKWTAGKMFPKMYGDRIHNELSGEVKISHEEAVRSLLAGPPLD